MATQKQIPAIVTNKNTLKTAIEKRILEARLLQTIRPQVHVAISDKPLDGRWIANISITDAADGSHRGIGSASATTTENPHTGIVEWRIGRIGWTV